MQTVYANIFAILVDDKRETVQKAKELLKEEISKRFKLVEIEAVTITPALDASYELSVETDDPESFDGARLMLDLLDFLKAHPEVFSVTEDYIKEVHKFNDIEPTELVVKL